MVKDFRYFPRPMRVSYPFAAVPNHVVRGGHGTANIAVLACLLSHAGIGAVCNAAIPTIARELKCDVKTVRKSLAYWLKHGPGFGIHITRDKRPGFTDIFSVVILEMRNVLDGGDFSTGTVKNGGTEKVTPMQNGRGVLPKCTGVPLPKSTDKEEPLEEEPIRRYQDKSFLHSSDWESIGQTMNKLRK